MDFEIIEHDIGASLTWDRSILNDIDERFRQLTMANPKSIMGVEAYEQYRSSLVAWVSKEVAPKETAFRGYFGQKYMLPGTDHFSSVKPDGDQHPAYLLVLNLYDDFRKRISADEFEGDAKRPFSDCDTRVVTDEQRVRRSAISRDGNWLVYVDEHPRGQRIMLKQLGARPGAPKEIIAPSPHVYHALTLCPGGDCFYFTRADETNAACATLYRSTLLGDSVRKVVSDVDSGVGVSEDGHRLTFVRGSSSGQQSDLMTCRSDGTDVRSIARRTQPEYISTDAAPRWSRDDKAIYFAAGNQITGPATRLIRYDVDSRKETALKDVWWSISSIVPVGRRGVIFSADAKTDVAHRLWYATPSADAHAITPDGDYRSCSADSTGEILACVRRFTESALFVAEPANGWMSRQITNARGDAGVYGVTWKTADEIIYVSSDDLTRQLWAVHSDGGSGRQLTLPEEAGPANVFPRSCPKSGTVLLTSITRKAFVVEQSASGDRKTLHEGFYPDCADDGSIISTNIDPRKRGVWLFRPDGTSRQIAENLSRATISHDGRFVAGLEQQKDSDRWNLTIIPIDGPGAPTKLAELQAAPRRLPWLRWSRDNRAVTYIQPGDGNTVIVRAAGLDGQITELGRLPAPRVFHFDWSPDGHQLVYASGKMKEDVIVFRNVKKRTVSAE